jgi:hypothetical protein
MYNFQPMKNKSKEMARKHHTKNLKANSRKLSSVPISFVRDCLKCQIKRGGGKKIRQAQKCNKIPTNGYIIHLPI